MSALLSEKSGSDLEGCPGHERLRFRGFLWWLAWAHPDRLAADFPGVDLQPFIALVAKDAIVVESPPLLESVCDDPDDDVFISCAIASGTEFIVSGDRALLRASGYGGVKALSPRVFVDHHIEGVNRKKRR